MIWVWLWLGAVLFLGGLFLGGICIGVSVGASRAEEEARRAFKDGVKRGLSR